METIVIPVVVALIASGPAYINSRKTRKAVGSPNGHGPVVDMLEHSLRSIGRIEDKLDVHIQDQLLHHRMTEDNQ